MTPGETLAVKPIRTLPRTRLTHWAQVTESGALPKLALCKRARAGEFVTTDDDLVPLTVTCHRCNVTKQKYL